MQLDNSIFKAYDIRGIAGENLSEEIMELLGKAYGSFILRNGGKKIVSGRDTRRTSPAYHQALNKGLQSTGCEVWDMGVITTPTMYFACHKYEVDGGTMITASHNPADFNGLKMSWKKMSLSSEKILEIRDILLSGNFEKGEGKYIEFPSANEDHEKDIVTKIKLNKKMKVVIDTSGAVAGLFVPKLLSSLGCEVEVVNGEIDPDFSAHEPDPIVMDNYPVLINKMKEVNADFGAMFDGDADRVGFVDEKGGIWLGDKIQMLLARDILPKHPGSKVIVELKNSEAVIEEVERLGGVPIMGKTGHTLIEEKLHEENAILAAEMSCHYYIADDWYKFDDASYAISRVLQIVANSGKSFSELMNELPNYPATPEYRVSVPADRQLQIVEEVVEYFKDKCDKYIDLDGIRGYKYDGWFLVRSSNTQPLISVRAEAKTVEGLEKIKQFVKDKLDMIDGVNLDWGRQHG